MRSGHTAGTNVPDLDMQPTASRRSTIKRHSPPRLVVDVTPNDMRVRKKMGLSNAFPESRERKHERPRMIFMQHPPVQFSASEFVASEFVHLTKQGKGTLALTIATVATIKALAGHLNDKDGRLVYALALKADFSRLRDSASSTQQAGALLLGLLNAAGGIKRIDLGACVLEKEDYRALARFLSAQGCELEMLSMEAGRLPEEEAQNLGDALKACGSLKSFVLKSDSLRPKIWMCMLESLAACTHFETLIIEATTTQALPLSRLTAIIKNNHRLSELCITLRVKGTYNKAMVGPVLETQFNEFCATLARNISLRVLDLSCHPFLPSYVNRLIQALDAHPCLERLNLGAIVLSKQQFDKINVILKRNAQSNREQAAWFGKAALDMLVPATNNQTDCLWPVELSDVVVSYMDIQTLEEMRRGLETGFPPPVRSKTSTSSSDQQ
jgi:hypothetical protein